LFKYLRFGLVPTKVFKSDKRNTSGCGQIEKSLIQKKQNSI
jgi:hypothetical protein